MRMKKLITLTLAVILTFTLSACGGGNSAPPGGGNADPPASSDNNAPSDDGNTPSNGGNNSAPGDVFGFGLDFIEKNLKDNYRIAYDITVYDDGESDSVSMEQIWTPEGIYFATDGEGMLLIRNGDEYDVYVDVGDGSYEKIPMSYPKDAAEAMVAGLTGYMTAYASFGSMLDRDGSETVAGRDCEKYSFDYTYPLYNYKFKYTYSIDKATGVCLKFKMDLQGDGQKVGYEFICTEFQTGGVSLPKYN